MEWTWVAARDGDIVTKYKNLGNGKFGFEAYDLSKEDNEVTNIYDGSQPYFAKISPLLLKYRKSLTDAYDVSLGKGPRKNDISRDEAVKRLRSLGYIK